MKKLKCDYCGKEITSKVPQDIDPGATICSWCYPAIAHRGIYNIHVPRPNEAAKLTGGLRSVILFLVGGDARGYRRWRDETTPYMKQIARDGNPVASADLIKRIILKNTPSSTKARSDIKRLHDALGIMKEGYEYRMAQTILTYYVLWRIKPDIYFNDYETYIRGTMFNVARSIARREYQNGVKKKYFIVNKYHVAITHIEASGYIINNVVSLYKQELDPLIDEYLAKVDNSEKTS